MRPIRLELKNFTAYRETEVLEFDDLDLFAITGPTGSGKSSLLDAMTFALYGKTPRIGNRSVLLIAQGQPALSVCLDFAVDDRRFRVVRTAGRKATGATIRLEEWRAGSWESYGEGADRIRDATRLIQQLVGLDYEAFTRSVLLPQGQFQEFLVGDPAERRNILTELLGLELFEQMARRAGELGREARSAAQAKDEVLARTYAGVDEEAAKEARTRAKHATARSKAMAEVERSLEGLAKESEGLERRIDGLDDLDGETRELARSALVTVESLEAVVRALAEAASVMSGAEERAAAAEASAAEAVAALAQAESSWGSVESLATLRAGLDQFAALEGRINRAEASLEATRSAIEARSSALRDAQETLTETAAAAERAGVARSEVEADHEQAHRADLVGALTRGRKAGDPCPVCDRPMEKVPKVDTRALARVAKVLERAREAELKAERRLRTAEQETARAEHDLQTARADADRVSAELQTMQEERSGALPVLQAAFGGDLPGEPVREADRRLDEMRSRRRRVEETQALASEARSAAVLVRDSSRDVEAKATELVGALRGLQVGAVIRRAHQLVPRLEVAPELVGAIPGEPGPALEAGRGMAAGLAGLAEALRFATRELREALAEIVARARELLPEGMPRDMVTDVYDLLAAARTLVKDLVDEAAEARSDSQRLSQQVKERRELEAEVKARSEEAAVYQSLAGELRADRLITFLQGEALELLAAAGSDRLSFLSQGRYRLAFEEDEFFVEDRQNGDERRSVRTLSGGETFLASLALALALSEQIQSLAVTQRSRLQSLFIDEGFGNLDGEVLEVAAEALTQLGGQDRLVGVITHVSELAERLPVRIEVQPSPSGSRLEVVP